MPWGKVGSLAAILETGFYNFQSLKWTPKIQADFAIGLQFIHLEYSSLGLHCLM